MSETPIAKISAKKALRLFWIWNLIGALAFARVFLTRYVPAENGLDELGYVIGHDFINMWAGAKLLLAGKVADLNLIRQYNFDLDALFGGIDTKNHNFSYPPNIFMLIIGFGFFGYFTALAIWTAGGVTAFVAALRANKWFHPGLSEIALFLLSPVAIINYILGQNGFFTGCFFLGGLLLSETSPILAGILIGLLTVKPHLGIILVAVLLVRRNVRCFISASVTTALLAGISLIFWGMTPWRDYIDMAINVQTTILTESGGYFMMMPGLYSNVIMSQNPTALSKIIWGVLQFLVALWTMYVSLKDVRKDGLTPRSILLVSMAALMITPYNFNYDMVAVMGALLVYIATAGEITWGVFMLFGVLWALPLLIYELKLKMLPFPSFVMPAVFLYFCWFEKRAKATEPRDEQSF
ncbi:MAG: glycosyltransferase family 87 protein [Micavibrio sp.]|nr:glycosyltransferase family 87 protein [Micavibrio sp.]